MAVTVLIKDQAKVKALEEVGRFFADRYPSYFASCVEDMKSLKEHSTAEYDGGKGRTVYVKLKVPIVLWMACEAVIPGFGQDSDDVELFNKTLSALSGAADFKAKPCLIVPDNYTKEPAANEKAQEA